MISDGGGGGGEEKEIVIKDLELITIGGAGGSITIHCDDGRIEYPDNLPEAAKTFWDAMRSFFPGMSRCENCKWAVKAQTAKNSAGQCIEPSKELGCTRLNKPRTKAETVGMDFCGVHFCVAWLLVDPDFGCVQWEAKDKDD